MIAGPARCPLLPVHLHGVHNMAGLQLLPLPRLRNPSVCGQCASPPPLCRPAVPASCSLAASPCSPPAQRLTPRPKLSASSVTPGPHDANGGG
jgi:hypothetical protein